MSRRKTRWADIPEGMDNPLSYAITTRDRSTIAMVNAAVKQKQVMLAFQPIVPAQNPSQVIFYEGLARVLDPTGRIIPARDFISAIEETETGRIVDCIALEKGLKALDAVPDLRLSINLSARSIGYGRWSRILRRGLARNPTIADRLILEITESSAMTVPEHVISFMAEWQKRGLSFALDDFGSGYTSFRYLRDFYFDILKIDGQFIRGIAEDTDAQVLTSALLAIAQQFDMVTIAESVENAADANYLAALGVNCLQGYYFAAPTVHPPWEEDNRSRRA